MALDTAETIKARNNLERMLAHQIAVAHTGAMSLQGAAIMVGDRSSVIFAAPEEFGQFIKRQC